MQCKWNKIYLVTRKVEKAVVPVKLHMNYKHEILLLQLLSHFSVQLCLELVHILIHIKVAIMESISKYALLPIKWCLST